MKMHSDRRSFLRSMLGLPLLALAPVVMAEPKKVDPKVDDKVDVQAMALGYVTMTVSNANADNFSVWIVGRGDDGVYGIYPGHRTDWAVR